MLNQLFFSTILLVTATEALLNTVGWTQSVTVTGRLICNGEPATGVKLKLYDDGTVEDSLMKLEYLNGDSDGTFSISGKHTDILTIDPKLNIYHRCDYHGLCYKKLVIFIPHSYVTDGETAERAYDIGTLNLQNRIVGETTDCINW